MRCDAVAGAVAAAPTCTGAAAAAAAVVASSSVSTSVNGGIVETPLYTPHDNVLIPAVHQLSYELLLSKLPRASMPPI